MEYGDHCPDVVQKICKGDASIRKNREMNAEMKEKK